MIVPSARHFPSMVIESWGAVRNPRIRTAWRTTNEPREIEIVDGILTRVVVGVARSTLHRISCQESPEARVVWASPHLNERTSGIKFLIPAACPALGERIGGCRAYADRTKWVIGVDGSSCAAGAGFSDEVAVGVVVLVRDWGGAQGSSGVMGQVAAPSAVYISERQGRGRRGCTATSEDATPCLPSRGRASGALSAEPYRVELVVERCAGEAASRMAAAAIPVNGV
jgi:hypothetical protein